MITGERGDFGGYTTQFTLETCLGEGWIKERSEAQHALWVRDAWTYSKQGWPNVRFLSGIDSGLRTQIVIEASPQ